MSKVAAHDSLKARLEFMGLDTAAQTALRDLKPLIARSIGPALSTFYEKVRATPETRRFFKDDKHMAAAKAAQEKHWELVAGADYGEAYVRAVTATGQAHARLGVEPQWYIGGYAVVVEQLIHSLVKERAPRFLGRPVGAGHGLAEALSVLVKSVFLDMDLSISTYLEAVVEERRRSEEARAANQAHQMAALQSLEQALQLLADGDLTSRMNGEVAADFAKLKEHFNASIEALQQAFVAVNTNVMAIRSGTEEITTAADDLSRRTEQQAASLEETAASLSEITSTVKTTAQSAEHAREVVTAAKVDAEKSESVVRQAVEAMGGIEKSSKQIGQIIGVIDEIAFQTNLLALNAGVEAARAGDAGRGFAVVASEVRSLAQRSAEAAKEIKTLISNSTTQVDKGVELVVETGKALERIVAHVGEISNVVTTIAASAKDQSSGLHQINTAVGQMDQVTQQNAAMVEETTAAAHSLAKETEELAQLVDRFHIGETAAAPKRRPAPKPAPAKQARPALKQVAHRGAPAAARKAAPEAAAQTWEEF